MAFSDPYGILVVLLREWAAEIQRIIVEKVATVSYALSVIPGVY